MELNNNMLRIVVKANQTKLAEDPAVKEKELAKEHIITGLFQEKKKRATFEISKDYGKKVDDIIADFKNGKISRKVDVIRLLSDAGLERTEIANLTGIIYQQVRQALVNRKDGL